MIALDPSTTHSGGPVSQQWRYLWGRRDESTEADPMETRGDRSCHLVPPSMMLVYEHTPPVPCTPRVQRDFLQPHPR